MSSNSVGNSRKAIKCIFSDLDQEAMDELEKQKIKNKYKKGQQIFMQGNMPFGIYFVLSGKVKISIMGKDGKESIIRLAKTGEVLGHCNIFNNEAYTASAIAQEDSVISFMEKDFFLDAVTKYPTITLNLISQLSRTMGHYETNNVALMQKNVRERFAGLLITFKNTYGEKDGNSTRLDLKITREEMASMIGTTVETLARLATEFKNERIIEQDGKTILIIDEEKLISYANI